MTNASVVVVSIEDDGCMFSTRGECCFVHKSNMLRRRLASAARHVSAHSGDNPELIVEAECSWSKASIGCPLSVVLRGASPSSNCAAFLTPTAFNPQITPTPTPPSSTSSVLCLCVDVLSSPSSCTRVFPEHLIVGRSRRG